MDLDYKGVDSQAQLKLGNGQFYGVNYLQSVSNALSLGGEGTRSRRAAPKPTSRVRRAVRGR